MSETLSYAPAGSDYGAPPRSNRPHLIAALAILIAAGGFLRYANATGALRILKLPVPLVRDLSELDRGCLLPYRVQDAARLPQEVESELGTKWYINWSIEDTSASPESWKRAGNVFVTYYTGNPDQVPHVPEECYQQGAHSKQRDDATAFKLPTKDVEYPVRRLVFYAPGGRGPATFVYYLFVVNGDFYINRDGVRYRMGRPSEKYLYYSKVELAFRRADTREPTPEMDRLAERLLGRIIETLVKEHLPDTQAWERQAAAAGPTTSR